MSYQTYTTKALVCGSKDSYTSDRSYLLFTESAGMLWASARSVRTEISKQRPALQEFSVLRVSLVKGRGGWRIGSAEALGNPFLAATTRVERTMVTQLVRQLRRYVHGEGTLSYIYNDVLNTLSSLSSLDDKEITTLSDIFLVRLLHSLGYIGSDEEINSLLSATTTLEALSIYQDNQSKAITKAINRAEQASHL